MNETTKAILRLCRRCEINKLLKHFPKNVSSKDGRLNTCKFCKNGDQRAYSLANREKVNRKAREYYSANKDEIKVNRVRNKDKTKIYGKKYYQENKALLNAKTRKYRADNKEHYKAKRDQNKEKTKAYQLANKDKIKAKRDARKDQIKIYDRKRYLKRIEEKRKNDEK